MMNDMTNAQPLAGECISSYDSRKLSYRAAHERLVTMGGEWIDNTKTGVVYRHKEYLNPYNGVAALVQDWNHLQLAASDKDLIAAHAVAPGAPRKRKSNTMPPRPVHERVRRVRMMDKYVDPDTTGAIHNIKRRTRMRVAHR